MKRIPRGDCPTLSNIYLGGVFSPLLANIALNGIETIHTSVRYADDMVFILKPKDNAEEIRSKIDEFLAQQGLKVKERKTRLVHSTNPPVKQ